MRKVSHLIGSSPLPSHRAPYLASSCIRFSSTNTNTSASIDVSGNVGSSSRSGTSTGSDDQTLRTAKTFTSRKTSSPPIAQPRPPPPPTRTLKNFASFADADLLTFTAGDNTASTPSPLPLRHTPRPPSVFKSRPSFDGPNSSTLPKTVLKTNVLAGKYEMNPDDTREALGGPEIRRDTSDSKSLAKRPRLGGRRLHRPAFNRHPSPTRLSQQEGSSTPKAEQLDDQSSQNGKPGKRKAGLKVPIRTVYRSTDELVTAHTGFIRYQALGSAASSDRSASLGGVISYERLRDACPCPKCKHPSTRQKIHTSGEAARMVESFTDRALSYDELHQIPKKGEGFRVRWPSPDAKEAPHNSWYPISLIRQLASGNARATPYLTGQLRRRIWDRKRLLEESENLHIDYERLNAVSGTGSFQPRPKVQLELLEQLQKWGIVIIRGVPTDKTSNKECTLRTVAESIGELRNTFYGETWDVKSVKDSKNVAYTDLNLGLHMDLLYFSQPPRFQLLHCLRNRVVGGSSYFVDSFAAVSKIADKDYATYKTLQASRLDYEYDNDGHYLTFRHPLFEYQRTSQLNSVVNWSPPFQAAPLVSGVTKYTENVSQALGAQRRMYKALDEFQHAIDDPELRYEFTLAEGDLVMFDNRRVLHARTAFRNKTEQERAAECGATGGDLVPELKNGEPNRWLKGCYLDGEAVWDKLVSLNDAVRGESIGVERVDEAGDSVARDSVVGDSESVGEEGVRESAIEGNERAVNDKDDRQRVDESLALPPFSTTPSSLPAAAHDPLRPTYPTTELGLPVTPLPSIVPKIPATTISRETFVRLHELSALNPPRQGSVEEAELMSGLGELIGLMDLVQAVDLGDDSLSDLLTEGVVGEIVIDGRHEIQAQSAAAAAAAAATEAKVEDVEANGRELLEYATRRVGDYYGFRVEGQSSEG